MQTFINEEIPKAFMSMPWSHIEPDDNITMFVGVDQHEVMDAGDAAEKFIDWEVRFDTVTNQWVACVVW